MAMSVEPSPDTSATRSAARGALLLGLFAALGATLVGTTYQLTRERIADNQARRLQQTLHEILPPGAHDNPLHEDIVSVSDAALGSADGQSLIYRARKNGSPVAAILEVTAPDGYSGAIRMLVGIYTSGELAGVRVLEHRETPGLGDGIERARSDWIEGFSGKSLDNPTADAWAVKRDGGAFDQFTGATITPRAVVTAVRNALIYFRGHQAEIFAPRASQS